MATDERWVPADSERSNARMIRERLLVDRAAAARFLPFHVPARAPEDVLAEVESMIEPELPLSVVLLGMGEDMHTASLFPGVDGLEAALAPNAPILAVMRPDSQPEPRISLSARVLDAAISKHLVIYGDAKREALERAKSLPPEEAPIQAVLSEMTVHWAPWARAEGTHARVRGAFTQVCRTCSQIWAVPFGRAYFYGQPSATAPSRSIRDWRKRSGRG